MPTAPDDLTGLVFYWTLGVFYISSYDILTETPIDPRENPAAWAPILQELQMRNVTLLFAARDAALNNAIVLKEFLEEKTLKP